MTSSYHEIRDAEYGTDALSASGEVDTDVIPSAKKFLSKARNWVGDLSLDGIVSQEGQQVTYVAQDITEQIKASPVKGTLWTDMLRSIIRRCGNCNLFKVLGLQLQLTDVESQPSVSDGQEAKHSSVVINEIETEAKRLASSVDTLTENLTGILHSVRFETDLTLLHDRLKYFI